MTTINTADLGTVTGGQTDAATTTPEQTANEGLMGMWTADGISAAKCSNLDFASQAFANSPGALAQTQAAADKCWADLRQGMLTGQR